MGTDLLDILATEHREVQGLFDEYFALATMALHSKESVSARIFASLDRHSRMEEELFYPELETSTVTADAIREARREHQAIDSLIGQLRESGPGDEMFDTRMKALFESVAEHVAEEEEEIFPMALDVLGDDRLAQIAQRVEAFRAELEEPDDENEPPTIPGVPRI